ncbi:cytochrome b [Devosia pacifica]|uniref:Cytochrome b n=1 Tax=Devosia pacifica TaxID=1335967 RepID=A0A918VSF8_9HYPH|nr:cytochrome b/b6 domain-containing protein [Devosia pacifica]GHA20555.1 cytochrome b [Devosia pacifica]
MAAINKPSGYSVTQVALHWTIAALVLLQLFYHEPMEIAFETRMTGETGGDPRLHIIVGLAILALALWRLVLRLRHGVPPKPAEEPAILAALANGVHAIFYILLFAMPLSGLAAWFGGAEAAANAHSVMRLLFLALIGLHVLGALGQHFVFKTNVLKRMLKPQT